MSIEFNTAFNATNISNTADFSALLVGDPPKQGLVPGYKWDWQEPETDGDGKRVGSGQWLQVRDETKSLPAKERPAKEYNGKQD